MKKFLIFTIALCMLASASCGSKPEEILITMDNVEQYFEVKDNIVTFPENEFGEFETAEVNHYVAIKEEYADRIDLETTDVTFEVTHNEYFCKKPKIDFKNKTLHFGEVIDDSPVFEKEVRTYYYYDLFNYENGEYFIAMSAYSRQYNMDDPYFDKSEHTIAKDFEITNVTGTLVLNK